MHTANPLLIHAEPNDALTPANIKVQMEDQEVQGQWHSLLPQDRKEKLHETVPYCAKWVWIEI